jgi:Na+(H+)/acetate symporter ActP
LGGLYWKRASSTGAVLALLAGTVAVLGLTPVQDGIGTLATGLTDLVPALRETLLAIPGVSLDPSDQYSLLVEIPPARVGLTSIGATLAALIIGSLLFPDKNKTQDQSPQITRET